MNYKPVSMISRFGRTVLPERCGVSALNGTTLSRNASVYYHHTTHPHVTGTMLEIPLIPPRLVAGLRCMAICLRYGQYLSPRECHPLHRWVFLECLPCCLHA